MASKLCCTAEQDAHSSSPDLPNIRVSEATPAKRPLLPKPGGSQNSRFTSARTEDLHELRQIFNDAKEASSTDTTPAKHGRSPFTRPSIYSLHSLHKIKSVHQLLKGKLSRDLRKATSSSHMKRDVAKKDAVNVGPDTIVKIPRDGPNLQLKITKADLRKDLLSDKKPEEGGYDSDAEVLDDIAKQIGKRSPSKRPSLHSIDWASTPGSKGTPESKKTFDSPDAGPSCLSYQLSPSELAGNTPETVKVGQFTSTPTLMLIKRRSNDKARQLRRSQSVDSAEPPPSSPLSPVLLPKLSSNDTDGIPWSVSMHESLRLASFPVPPTHLTREPSEPSLRPDAVSSATSEREAKHQSTPSHQVAATSNESSATTPGQELKDSMVTPRVSDCVKDRDLSENLSPAEPELAYATREDEGQEDSSRRSVHLYSMRISHHLRSGSLLSWDQLADAPELPTPPRTFRDRSVSDLSRVSKRAVRSRHDRQTSSSGFASSRVPSKWGNVVPGQHKEDMSSVYSSRPHSPPDSLGGSTGNLPLPVTHEESSKRTAVDVPPTSDNLPTDNEETPKPVKRHGITNLQALERASSKDTLLKEPKLARKNSVTDTKKSRFREEFSPPPPRKRSHHTISFLNILRPRNSVRSQSDTNLRSAKTATDGAFDTPDTSTTRECRLSRSLISLQKEQQAGGEGKEVWERALKAHQDERSTLFLPKNKALATTSPFRERSGSILGRPKSTTSLSPLATNEEAHAADAPVPNDTDPGPSSLPKLLKRRSALVHANDETSSPDFEVQTAFNKQTETKETVGAWGRYPSDSRLERTGSAGHRDSVQARDFALEAAIQFAKGEDDIDPTAKPESPLSSGGKKRKKRIGSGRMSKSRSMTLSKTFLKNYSKIFRSQSTEFQRHGHGHRSSVATGGTLEYPELEILPDVWRRAIVEDKAQELSKEEVNSVTKEEKTEPLTHSKSTSKGKHRADDSTSTLRPPHQPNDPNLMLDGIVDLDTPTDRARVWSVYYEDCIPDFPRLSTDLIELQDFGSRRASDSKRASMHSQTLPARFKHHSRHGSRVSRASVASIVPSFKSVADAEGGADGGGHGQGQSQGKNSSGESMSMASVRRSTMDLVALYREQEDTERMRVLSLVRGESVRLGAV